MNGDGGWEWKVVFRGVTSCRLGSFVGYFASARSAGSTRSIGRGEARGKVKEGVVFIVGFQAVARARWLDLSSIFHGCLKSISIGHVLPLPLPRC